MILFLTKSDNGDNDAQLVDSTVSRNRAMVPHVIVEHGQLYCSQM